jgi:rubrerythrin
MQKIDEKTRTMKLPRVPWWIESNQEFELFMHDHPDLKDPYDGPPGMVSSLVSLKKPFTCRGCGTVFTMYTPGYEEACPFCNTPTGGKLNGPAQR